MSRTITSPFTETRNMFANYINYTKPLDFAQWNDLPEDAKAAALFVQFFDQITLAWYKTRSFYTPEEDGVSTMVQYLIKNVPVIVENPKRFTAGYIYRVAYNCLYCICHDIKRDRERFESEISNICVSGDSELDLFDTICDKGQVEDEILRNELWTVIRKAGLSSDTLKMLEEVADGVSHLKLDEATLNKLQSALKPYLNAQC